MRGWIDGAGWAVGLAGALFAFSLLMLALEAQSSDVVLWTGQHVVGTEQDGLAYFQWHGHTYSAVVPGNGSAKTVDVYFDPANPLDAMADNPVDRTITGLLIGGPVIVGAAVLATGLTRKRRWARRQLRAAARGEEQDPFVFARLLAARRGDGRPS